MFSAGQNIAGGNGRGPRVAGQAEHLELAGLEPVNVVSNPSFTKAPLHIWEMTSPQGAQTVQVRSPNAQFVQVLTDGAPYPGAPLPRFDLPRAPVNKTTFPLASAGQLSPAFAAGMNSNTLGEAEKSWQVIRAANSEAFALQNESIHGEVRLRPIFAGVEQTKAAHFLPVLESADFKPSLQHPRTFTVEVIIYEFWGLPKSVDNRLQAWQRNFWQQYFSHGENRHGLSRDELLRSYEQAMLLVRNDLSQMIADEKFWFQETLDPVEFSGHELFPPQADTDALLLRAKAFATTADFQYEPQVLPSAVENDMQEKPLDEDLWVFPPVAEQPMELPEGSGIASIIDPLAEKSPQYAISPEQAFDDLVNAQFTSDRHKRLARLALRTALESLIDSFDASNKAPGSLPTPSTINRAVQKAIDHVYQKNRDGSYLNTPPSDWLKQSFQNYVAANAVPLGLIGRKGLQADEEAVTNEMASLPPAEAVANVVLQTPRWLAEINGYAQGFAEPGENPIAPHAAAARAQLRELETLLGDVNDHGAVSAQLNSPTRIRATLRHTAAIQAERNAARRISLAARVYAERAHYAAQVHEHLERLEAYIDEWFSNHHLTLEQAESLRIALRIYLTYWLEQGNEDRTRLTYSPLALRDALAQLPHDDEFALPAMTALLAAYAAQHGVDAAAPYQVFLDPSADIGPDGLVLSSSFAQRLSTLTAVLNIPEANLVHQARQLIADLVCFEAEAERTVRIGTVLGTAAQARNAVRLLGIEDLRAALGENCFTELMAYVDMLRNDGQDADAFFAFALHYFRRFFHRYPEMFGHPELLANENIDQGIIANIFLHVQDADTQFTDATLAQFAELYQLLLNAAAEAPDRATVQALADARRPQTTEHRNYLPYSSDPAVQEQGLRGFLGNLPGFTSKENQAEFRAAVGVTWNAAQHWGATRPRPPREVERIHRENGREVRYTTDGLADEDFNAIREMRRELNKSIPEQKAEVDDAMWREYIGYQRAHNRLEYVTAHPSNSSLGNVLNLYHHAQEYAHAQGYEIDFFDFLCALSPVFRRMRDTARVDDEHLVVYIAVPRFMRDLPFVNWGYSTWAQIVQERGIANLVLAGTMGNHASGQTRFPEYRTLGQYTERLNNGDDAAYNFAAGLMRWAYLLDNGLNVYDVMGNLATQTDAEATPSRFRIQLVDDPSDIPEGAEPIVSGSRRAMRHHAQRGVYGNRIQFLETYLAAIDLLPGEVTLRDHQNQPVTLATLRERLARYRTQEQVYRSILNDHAPEIAAGRSHQDLENIFRFYRELSTFIEQVVFFTAIHGEIETARLAFPYRAIADMRNHSHDPATWAGETVIPINDLPHVAADEHWSQERVADLIQCRVLVRFFENSGSLQAAPGSQLTADAIIASLQRYWQGTSSSLAQAVADYLYLEAWRAQNLADFDERGSAVRPSGGGRTQNFFGPVLPARQGAGTWLDQLLAFAQSPEGGNLSAELAKQAVEALHDYFREVPTSLARFWPAALDERIARHFTEPTEQALAREAILRFLPRVGVPNRVERITLDPDRAVENQLAEIAVRDYVSMFPVHDELIASQVPYDRQLMHEFVQRTISVHGTSRRLRIRDIEAYAMRVLDNYNLRLPEPNRDLGANTLSLLAHGRALLRLADFARVWAADQAVSLDIANMRTAYQILTPQLLRGQRVSRSEVARALELPAERPEVTALSEFIAEQAEDLTTWQNLLTHPVDGIDAFVRRRFRNTTYVRADGLINLATSHGRQALAAEHDIDLASAAHDAVDDIFEPFPNITQRQAISYAALYRHYLHDTQRRFAEQVAQAQAVMEEVSLAIQAQDLSLTETREAFEAEVFRRLPSLGSRAALAELDRAYRITSELTAMSPATNLNQELTRIFDEEIAPFYTQRNTRMIEIQPVFQANQASLNTSLNSVEAELASLNEIATLPADANRELTNAKITEVEAAIARAKQLESALNSQAGEFNNLESLADEAETFGINLSTELNNLRAAYRRVQESFAATLAQLEAIHENAELRLLELDEADATAAQAAAAAKLATERIAQAAQLIEDIDAAIAGIEAIRIPDVEEGIEVSLREVQENHEHVEQQFARNLDILRKRMEAYAGLEISQAEYQALKQETGEQLAAMFRYLKTYLPPNMLDQVSAEIEKLNALRAQIEELLGQELPDVAQASLQAALEKIEKLSAELNAFLDLKSYADYLSEQTKALFNQLAVLREQLVLGRNFQLSQLADLLPTDEARRVDGDIERIITFRRNAKLTELYQTQLRQALTPILRGQLLTNGKEVFFVSQEQAAAIQAWLQGPRREPLRIKDIFDRASALKPEDVEAQPLILLPVPKTGDHPATRFTQALRLLTEENSLEARLVLDFQKNAPDLIELLYQYLMAAEPALQTREQVRLFVRRFAISYQKAILEALGGDNQAKQDRVRERYFTTESKRIEQTTTPPAPVTPVELNLPVDLADLLPANAKTDAEIEAAVDALGILPTGAAYATRVEMWKRVVQEQGISFLSAQARRTLLSNEVKSAEQAMNQRLSALTALQIKVNMVQYILHVEPSIEESSLDSPQGLYQFLVQNRARVIAAVAAHRAANPGNDPHPGILPLSDYANVDNMSGDEIADRLMQTGLIPESIPEQAEILHSLGIPELIINQLSNNAKLRRMMAPVIVRAIAGIASPVSTQEMNDKAIAATDEVKHEATKLLFLRADYRHLLEHRSRVIAAVVAHEQAAAAEAKKKAEQAAALTSPQLPADLTDLLPTRTELNEMSAEQIHARVRALATELGMEEIIAVYDQRKALSLQSMLQRQNVDVAELSKALDRLYTVALIGDILALTNPSSGVNAESTQAELDDMASRDTFASLDDALRHLVARHLVNPDGLAAVLPAVAARRAANPDPNDPHPELLALSDYAQIGSMSAEQIMARLQATGLIPENLDERNDILASHGLERTFSQSDDAIMRALGMGGLIALQAGFINHYIGFLNQVTQDLPASNPRNIASELARDAARLKMLRDSYGIILLNRSRVIAAVVAREQAAAEAKKKAEQAAVTSPQLPVDLADLLPLHDKLSALDIKTEISRLGLPFSAVGQEELDKFSQSTEKNPLIKEVFELVVGMRDALRQSLPTTEFKSEDKATSSVVGESMRAATAFYDNADMTLQANKERFARLIMESVFEVYNVLQTHRDEILAAVAAQRAANPGNDPHPEMLSYSNYGRADISLTEIRNDLEALNLLPSIALLTDNVEINAKFLVMTIANLFKLLQMPEELAQIQEIARSAPNTLDGAVSAARMAYYTLIEYRSHFIRAVVAREQAAQQSEQTTAAGTTSSASAVSTDQTQSVTQSVDPAIVEAQTKRDTKYTSLKEILPIRSWARHLSPEAEAYESRLELTRLADYLGLRNTNDAKPDNAQLLAWMPNIAVAFGLPVEANTFEGMSLTDCYNWLYEHRSQIIAFLASRRAEATENSRYASVLPWLDLTRLDQLSQDDVMQRFLELGLIPASKAEQNAFIDRYLARKNKLSTSGLVTLNPSLTIRTEENRTTLLVLAALDLLQTDSTEIAQANPTASILAPSYQDAYRIALESRSGALAHLSSTQSEGELAYLLPRSNTMTSHPAHYHIVELGLAFGIEPQASQLFSSYTVEGANRAVAESLRIAQATLDRALPGRNLGLAARQTFDRAVDGHARNRLREAGRADMARAQRVITNAEDKYEALEDLYSFILKYRDEIIAALKQRVLQQSQLESPAAGPGEPNQLSTALQIVHSQVSTELEILTQQFVQTRSVNDLSQLPHEKGILAALKNLADALKESSAPEATASLQDMLDILRMANADAHLSAKLLAVQLWLETSQTQILSALGEKAQPALAYIQAKLKLLEKPD